MLLVLSLVPVSVLVGRGGLHPRPLRESRPGLEGWWIGWSPVLHLVEPRRGGWLLVERVDCRGGRLLDGCRCGRYGDRVLGWTGIE